LINVRNGEDFSIFSNDAKLTQNEEENVGYQSEEGDFELELFFS